MTTEIIEKLTQLQLKKIELYHHNKHLKKFNYTTPKEKSDYEYLRKVHQEKIDYLIGGIKEKIANFEKIEKETKDKVNEYHNLLETNPEYKDEEKKDKILDDLDLYQKDLNELQELINNLKQLVTKEV